MACMKRKILAGLYWILIVLVTGCGSNPAAEETAIDMVESNSDINLKQILEHPQLYVNRDVMFKGVVESVEYRKVNDEISLLTINLTPIENGEILKNGQTLSDQFLFIEKLREFEDLFTAVRYKNVRIRRHISPKMKQIAYDLKIASSKIEALAFYFEGVDKKAVGQAIHKVADGYQKLGDAFFIFQEAALKSSPGTEAKLSTTELEEVQKFENSLRKGGQLLLDFSVSLAKSKETIIDGNYSFNSSKVLNKQRPAEILTYSSLLDAESWEMKKAALFEPHEISNELSSAVRKLGEGDKLVNEGMTELGDLLNKTAVQLKKDSVPTLKCAYYGYNGSNLKRCVKAIKQMGHSPIGLNGKLLQSDLREEVNIMWVQANYLNLDGLIYSLDYGDENGTVRKAVDFYNWAESVEKGE